MDKRKPERPGSAERLAALAAIIALAAAVLIVRSPLRPTGKVVVITLIGLLLAAALGASAPASLYKPVGGP